MNPSYVLACKEFMKFLANHAKEPVLDLPEKSLTVMRVMKQQAMIV